MKSKDYTFSFTCKISAEQMYRTLLDVKLWWSGLFNESIKGKSQTIGDVFTFEAGEGLHYSKQELKEALPNVRIVWLVTASKLSFLKDQEEWTGSQIRFDLESTGNTTCKVTFTHVGLKKEIECYDSCSSAWAQYLHNLKTAYN